MSPSNKHPLWEPKVKWAPRAFTQVNTVSKSDFRPGSAKLKFVTHFYVVNLIRLILYYAAFNQNFI